MTDFEILNVLKNLNHPETGVWKPKTCSFNYYGTLVSQRDNHAGK